MPARTLTAHAAQTLPLPLGGTVTLGLTLTDTLAEGEDLTQRTYALLDEVEVLLDSHAAQLEAARQAHARRQMAQAADQVREGRVREM